jgi:hypothetical protein
VPPGLMAAAQRARPRPSLLLQGSVGRDGQGLSARSEKNGVWGKAIEVPGLAALAGPHGAELGSVSCASAGNCAAGGSYNAGHAGDRGFVVNEKNGVWGKAIEVPGLSSLNRGGNATVNSVSCASPSSCTAGGSFTDRSRFSRFQGFVT